ncbi:unnamed protein product, partial [Oppiella nova]
QGQIPNISHTGLHILSSIYAARNSTYKLNVHSNIAETDLKNNITTIIEMFMETTKDFENHECLKLKESEMGRITSNNCYAVICDQIIRYYGYDYQVVVGERAYLAAGL